ncbi:MAG TPA: CsbD family protein [Acidobacteriota bacterium]|nr:CsbD family protein [Acidobacteriota bacterium]
MNRDTIQGNWKQIKGKLKEKWGKFTDDDLEMLEGKRDQIIGKLQEKYGYTRERAEQEYNEFEGSLYTPTTRKY